jgi:predicted amidohydrolase YtcJ
MIQKGITRYSDRDQRVYGPRERTDRIVQLKALTTWGAHYLLREDVMGSLEPGKFADFIVLDRDYLTVPVEEIPDLRVLMTVVGGKIRHLLPSLAQEIGAQPEGPATWSTRPLDNLEAGRR